MTAILFDVRDALKTRQMASAAQIAAELQLPASAVQDMLGHWVRRGLAAEVTPTAAGGSCGSRACGSCGQCATPSPSQALYQWLGPAAPRTSHRVFALRPAA